MKTNKIYLRLAMILGIIAIVLTGCKKEEDLQPFKELQTNYNLKDTLKNNVWYYPNGDQYRFYDSTFTRRVGITSEYRKPGKYKVTNNSLYLEMETRNGIVRNTYDSCNLKNDTLWCVSNKIKTYILIR